MAPEHPHAFSVLVSLCWNSLTASEDWLVPRASFSDLLLQSLCLPCVVLPSLHSSAFPAQYCPSPVRVRPPTNMFARPKLVDAELPEFDALAFFWCPDLQCPVHPRCFSACVSQPFAMLMRSVLYFPSLYVHSVSTLFGLPSVPLALIFTFPLPFPSLAQTSLPSMP